MSNLERLITILRGEKRDEQNMVFMTSKDISQRHIMPDTDFELMKYCGLI
ncbi:MAG: hypothetical protein ACPKQO_11540 [Nitrososphaeraceae archaeon]